MTGNNMLLGQTDAASIEGGTLKRLFSWKPSLLTSFSLLGAVITAVIAVVFALALKYRLEQNTLQQGADSAADEATLVLSPNLSVADLSTP